MPVAELTPISSSDYGEVFTRRWVVDLILDMVGYTPDRDLGSMKLVEPSCGSGAFLVPIVERLLSSSRSLGRDVGSLGPALVAFDLLDANVGLARKAVLDVLVDHGLKPDDAYRLVQGWISTGDFLLHPHQDRSVDFVVGNPPYIRLENLDKRVGAAYRQQCSTMRGRADIYVGFFERGLDLLRPEGKLGYICADRWMRNQYGADLRQLIGSKYSVDSVVSMHDVDAFEESVSAYPAIIVLRNGQQGRAAVVEATSTFGTEHASDLSSWIASGDSRLNENGQFAGSITDSWFRGRDLWPSGAPGRLALIADLEARFAPLEDSLTGTRVGIGVATGCDDVYITENVDMVEADRLVPLLRASDTASGELKWSGRYLINPWNGSGLVDLRHYPRLTEYLRQNGERVRNRHVAKRRPEAWYRTIDRVDTELTGRPKLLLPDMKSAAHPVLDSGGYYPHHNLYFITSDTWDLEVLGGLILSDVANLFVGAYCVRMRGGTYRFQAQYLRRIRVPDQAMIPSSAAQALRDAFRSRDRVWATEVAAELYGISAQDLTRLAK
ncbi:MAG: Eco57I restriction-modification methylase domain-containing protein [Microthrixaceae bacterium]